MPQIITNYKQLTNEVLKLFKNIEKDNISLAKAQAMIKASNAVVSIQKAKILATKVVKDNSLHFFKD